jgi:hypothetical protein
MTMKRFMRVAAFTLAILLANMAQAQSPIERQTQTGASGSTLTFNNSIGSGLMKLEYKISGGPATASIVLKGCMRGGTCDTLQTDTNTTDTMRLVSGLWDYMTIEPTFTGGASPSVRVNWLAITRSPMGDAWGVIVSTSGVGSNVNVAQWGGAAVVTGGVNGSQGVGGLAADDAVAAGNPVFVAGKDTAGNIQSFSFQPNGTLNTVISGSGADGMQNTNLGRLATPTSATGQPLATYPSVFNGTTWDRLRGDTSGLEIHGSRSAFRCTVTVSTATTLQAVGGSCAAPGAGLSLYITDIAFHASASGIAADAFPTLKYGTGGTCGTGTTVFWGWLSAAAVNAVDNRQQPLKIPANNEICWISTTAGSKFIVISGFIGPG